MLLNEGAGEVLNVTVLDFRIAFNMGSVFTT